jgi:hypothetical protein
MGGRFNLVFEDKKNATQPATSRRNGFKFKKRTIALYEDYPLAWGDVRVSFIQFFF